MTTIELMPHYVIIPFVVLSHDWRLVCVLCSTHVLIPELRDSGPRLVVEAMVRDSFPTYDGTVYAKLMQKLEFSVSQFLLLPPDSIAANPCFATPEKICFWCFEV